MTIQHTHHDVRRSASSGRPLTLLALTAGLGLFLAPDAAAQDPDVEELRKRVERLENEREGRRPDDGRIEQLENENDELRQRQDVLEQELERFELRQVVPQVGDTEFGLGLGPAGAKIYGVEEGISIGGYGEFIFSQISGDTDVADAQRVVTYFGYRFNEKFLFNSEIEVEHGTTSSSSGTTSSEGSVSAEFAYLDYTGSEAFNLRAGLILVPIGLINEVHEPTTFLGARRPETERVIIPTTWRELGAGFYGSAGGFDYRAFVHTSLDGEQFTAKGLRSGRQKGNRATADDIAGSVRVDYVDVPGLLVGGSVFLGNTGQDNLSGTTPIPDLTTLILEAHAEYKTGPFRLRGLYASAFISNAGQFNAATANNLADRLEGWYVDAGVDVFAAWAPESEMAMTPFIRYERIDTQASMPTGFAAMSQFEDEIITFGVDFKPIDQIVVKADYQARDESNDRFNLLLGYVF